MNITNLQSFLDNSSDPFTTSSNISTILKNNNFKRLYENEPFNLIKGNNYYIVRNDSSIIAFKYPSNEISSAIITSSHLDSPCFKLKNNFLSIKSYDYLNIEPYGGMIINTWLDRPLGISGRIYHKSKHNELSILSDSLNDNLQLNSTLINIANAAIISNASLHMNKELNSAYKYRLDTDIKPICSLSESDLLQIIEDKYNIKKEDIISHDLYLYHNTPSTIVGLDKSLLSSPRLDDLACAYTSLQSFINSSNNNLSIFICLDNEEVGSLSINGANSDFVLSNLKRITNYSNDEDFYMFINNSYMLSCDNAHAYQSNYPSLYDFNNKVLLSKGIVIKHNANNKYTTNAKSSAIFKSILDKNNIAYQEYHNPSNIAGGSTLGNIILSNTSINSIDIGLAQLAMHSSYETIAINDLKTLYDALLLIYNTNLTYNKSSITIK